jgi:signal transduction histidine kinase
MRLSLRTQLSLWTGLAVLALVFIVTFVTQQVTLWNMERSIDSAIQRNAHMVAAVISSDITTDEQSYVQVIGDLASQKLPFLPPMLRVISPSGKPIIEFGKTSELIEQQLDQQLWLPEVATGHYSTLSSEGMEPLRAYTVSVSDPHTHNTLAIVQLVDSLRGLDEAKRSLWQNGLIIGLVGSLLAVFIGQILLRRGFRPLHAIVKSIDTIDYNHLKAGMQEDERLPELEQLAKSLSAMWLRLDMAVSEKQKVIGSMSHDLRTPLTALQGQLEVLLTQPALAPESRDSLERMLNETKRLVRLVKNLLINVQLESNPTFPIEDVNLKGVVDEVVRDMWVLAKGLEFNIVAKEDVVISGGRDLLKQMLINILDNSIKFTPKGGAIELHLFRENKWAVMRISDTGRGIAAEQLPHVTEAFYEVGSARKSVGEGSRLGLAIVKQIVSLHGGKLDIRSQENVGTTVTVQILVV